MLKLTDFSFVFKVNVLRPPRIFSILLSYYKELLISRLISLHQHSEALCIDHLWLKVGCNWLEHLRTSAGSKTCSWQIVD